MGAEFLDQCPLCQNAFAEGNTNRDFETDTYDLNCGSCGRYKATWEAVKNVLPRLPMGHLVRLRGAIRERSELASIHGDDCPLIRTDNINTYLSAAPELFDAPAKVRKLLSAIARRSNSLGDNREIVTARDYPIAFADDEDEFIFILSYAKQLEWVDGHETMASFDYHLTPAGWEQLRTRSRIDSPQAFVAMAFAEVMKATYTEAIEPAVRDECGFECKRIDAKEYNGAIVDEIKAEIRQSRFVIADVTHHRNGVYFEAGFADGLGVPVIWTCDDADSDNTAFDTKHLNQIRWTSHEDLRTKLKNRILGTIGPGPLAARETDA